MPPWPEGFAATPADRAALLRLAAMHSTTPLRLFALSGTAGSARACVETILGGGVVAEAERERVRDAMPDAIGDALSRCGARMVVPGDPEYAASLEDLADPPACLFVRGRPLSELYPRVAVVGARNCSPLGAEVAREIGSGLASGGLATVSGGARGIDTASHQGALAVGGTTIAILGCGIERAYPASNRRLLARIVESGCVVSEYPPGVAPEAFRFPARNRIVAALTEAVVVVEGAAGSGSLITADHALDLGRPIYAVPGAINNPLAEVPLALIRDGAGLVRGAQDLLTDLGRLDPAAQRPPGIPGGLSDAERTVLRSLTGPSLADQVARSIGWELSEVVTTLVELELRGLVRSVGGRFEPRFAVTG